jgi:F-type H+-transporting ATPase subunit b
MHHESFWGNPRTWVGVAFVLFFVIFGRKLWEAIAKILDARADAVRKELDEASRLRREAEAMLADAESRRTQALADAQRLIEGAHAEAARVQKAAAEEAEHAARRREQMAMERIAAAEKAAVEDVRKTAADVATTAAQEVISRGLAPDADAALVDRSINGLPSALSSRRAAA